MKLATDGHNLQRMSSTTGYYFLFVRFLIYRSVVWSIKCQKMVDLCFLTLKMTSSNVLLYP